jgi:hypothetical protein
MSRGSTRSVALACFGLSLLVGCSKASDSDRDTASTASAPLSSAQAATSASAVPPTAPAAPTVAIWTGTYTSAPGSMYVYDGGEWKGVHFRGDDASDGLGDGALSVTVDPKTHLVRGTGTGVLGEVVISGAVTDKEMTFSILRKDTTDRGLTGTGVGTVNGSAVSGSMKLSRGDAHIIREVKFTLAKSSS